MSQSSTPPTSSGDPVVDLLVEVERVAEREQTTAGNLLDRLVEALDEMDREEMINRLGVEESPRTVDFDMRGTDRSGKESRR